MVVCLVWHLSADNLLHIWCQSAITFLIKGPKIMNIFFRWQEMLVMKQSLICGVYLFHSCLDIWVRINVSQSEKVNLYTWECLHGQRCGQVWDTYRTTTETRETTLIEVEGIRKNITCELRLLQ